MPRNMAPVAKLHFARQSLSKVAPRRAPEPILISLIHQVPDLQEIHLRNKIFKIRIPRLPIGIFGVRIKNRDRL